MRPLNVNATLLRQRLKYYLDLVEYGRELNVVRNSVIIAHIVPSEEIKAVLREMGRLGLLDLLD